MPTNLAARSSTLPLPVGESIRVDGVGGSQEVAWPPADNYFWANSAQTIPMQVGVFQRPERFWLCAYYTVIGRVYGAWQGAVSQLRLTNQAGTPINDLNGRYFEYAYHAMENHGGVWKQCTIETKFFCEANQGYFVQALSGGGGGGYHRGHPMHQHMIGYTIGEGTL